MIILLILTTSLIHFSVISWENILFELFESERTEGHPRFKSTDFLRDYSVTKQLKPNSVGDKCAFSARSVTGKTVKHKFGLEQMGSPPWREFCFSKKSEEQIRLRANFLPAFIRIQLHTRRQVEIQLVWEKVVFCLWETAFPLCPLCEN